MLRDLIGGETRLDDYQAAVVPGGFSYGDHLGAGRIFATMLVARLREQLVRFLEAKKPLLGVCNGYQVLTEAGILPGRTPGERGMALIENQSARFEDRKVRLIVSEQECMWTEGLAGQVLEMPSAHGEGQAVVLRRRSRRLDARGVSLWRSARPADPGLPRQPQRLAPRRGRNS